MNLYQAMSSRINSIAPLSKATIRQTLDEMTDNSDYNTHVSNIFSLIASDLFSRNQDRKIFGANLKKIFVDSTDGVIVNLEELNSEQTLLISAYIQSYRAWEE